MMHQRPIAFPLLISLLRPRFPPLQFRGHRALRDRKREREGAHMGKKEGGKGDEGDKKAAAEGAVEKKKDEGGEKKKDDGGDKKKDDGTIIVVLKVDMHCEGCARKVRHSVKGFEGVEKVTTDCPNSKLTVVGKVDPWKLRDRVESKTHKKVVLVSPTNLPKKEEKKGGDEKKDGDEKKAGDDKAKKKADDKKPKEPAATTVALKIRLHCEGCIQRIRKTITKIKGVENVSIDPKEDLVTVKGTMDVKALPDYLKEKLKRSVAVVPSKKDDGGEKKEKAGGGGGGGGGDKKEKGGGGGAEKKGKEGGGGGGGGDKKAKEDGGGGGEKGKEESGPKVVAEANKMEYYGYGGGAVGGYAPYGYRIDMVHAPQIFSDENPNACSVM